MLIRQAVLLALFVALAQPSLAQAPRNPALTLATRPQLQAELTRLEQSKDSEREAELIRTRLQNGDFQAGDRIMLHVDGETQLSDTFTVGLNRELQLPQIGAISLAGLLRSELGPQLQTELGRFLRNPVITAQPLVTLVVEGQVPRPGYYPLTPQEPVVSAVTAAGGLGPRALTTAMRVERDLSTIWNGAKLQEALSRGYTVDQMNLRAGDRIVVPEKKDTERTVRIVAYVFSTILMGYTIAQVAH